MASKTTDCLDNICPLCNETIQYYAVGQCDHRICHVCSTRMRVLFEQSYCAICRSQMPKVLFTRKPHKFESINTHHFLVHRTAKIYFETEAVKTTFDKLLEYRCQICRNAKPVSNFNLLKEHMRREHNLHSCDLCVKNLKIFSSERKFYDRKKLAEHRRVGDTDDTSHRGHPLCEFCDERYLDNDELAKHLRKDHYYCHFCETDGISNQFFGDYSFLREHFLDQHYLCEEDDCVDIQFTNAFRSEIDLKAHKATAHSRNLRRMAARQARTLDIDFNLAPRPRAMHGRRRDIDHGVVSGEDYLEVHEDFQRHRGGHSGRGHRHQDRNAENMQRAMNNSMATMATERKPTSQPTSTLSRHSDDFPTLAQQPAVTQGVTAPTENQQSTTMANTLAMASNLSVQGGNMGHEDFPSLGGGRGNKRPITAPVGRAWSQKQKPPVKSHVVAAVQNTTTVKPEPQKITKPVPQKQMRSAFAWDAPAPKPAPTETSSVGRGNAVPYVTASDRNFPSLSSIGNSLMTPARAVAVEAGKQPSAPATGEYKKPEKRQSSATSADAKGRSVGSENMRVNSSVIDKKSDKTGKKNEQTNKKNDTTNTKSDQGSQKSEPVNQRDSATKKTDASSKKNSAKQKREPNDNTKPTLGTNNNKVDASTKNSDTVQEVGNVKKQEVGNVKKQEVGNVKKQEVGNVKKQEVISKKKQDSDIRKTPAVAATSTKSTEKDFPPLSAPDPLDGMSWVTKKTDTTKPNVNNKKKQDPDRRAAAALTKSIEKDFPVLGAPDCHDGTSWLTKPTIKHDTTKPLGKRDKVQQSEPPQKSKQQSASKSASWTNATIVSPEDFPRPKHASLASVVGGGGTQATEEVEEFTVIKGAKGKKKNKQVMEDLCRKHKFVFKVDAADSEEEEADEREREPSPAAADTCPEEITGVRSKKKKQNSVDRDGSVTAVGNRKESGGDVIAPSSKIAPTSLKDCADSVMAPPVTGTSAAKVAPPPGFVQPKQQPKTKAPPGFSAGSVVPPVPLVGVTLPAQFLLANGDFSSGADEAPTNGHDSQPPTPYDYHKPENFSVRNQKLIADIHTLLDYGDDDKFGQFKSCSNEFRRGEITAEDYDSRCIVIMGKECFDEVFPELLVLLPDIDRQQELLDAHYGTKKKGKSGRRGAHTPVACGTVNTKSKFYSCHHCRQVTMMKERDAHLRHHDTDADFPSLQAASGRGLYGMGSAGRVQDLTS